MGGSLFGHSQHYNPARLKAPYNWPGTKVEQGSWAQREMSVHMSVYMSVYTCLCTCVSAPFVPHIYVLSQAYDACVYTHVHVCRFFRFSPSLSEAYANLGSVTKKAATTHDSLR